MLTFPKCTVPHIPSAHRMYDISTKESQNKIASNWSPTWQYCYLGTVCYSISLELLEKLFCKWWMSKVESSIKNLWSVSSLPSPLCPPTLAPSVHLLLRAQVQNSKMFHLLFMPSACRRAAAWSRCTHCTITNFPKPGIALRLSIWQTVTQQLLVPVLKEIPHGHFKNLPLHPQKLHSEYFQNILRSAKRHFVLGTQNSLHL